MKIKCIDDEPLAQRILEKYINTISSLELVKKCNDATEAIAWLHENSADLIFLDIKMPQISGIDFLKSLMHPPQIILTTAYPEYALEGYEYAVVDYLLKPISFERFLKAVNKVSIPKNVQVKQDINHETSPFIFLKEDKISHKVFFEEITYIEAYGNFIKVFTDNRMILVSSTMNNIGKSLPEHLFIRTHKSYFVAIKKIDQIEGNMIIIGKKTIPIGTSYKKSIEQSVLKPTTK
jgi:DNA-binding LytR/AlgR family response regulator